MPRLSSLVQGLAAETAFTVLAVARSLKARGKHVVELEIGDSPYPSTPDAKQAGIRAIAENETGYCPSLGLPEFRDGGGPIRLGRVWLSGRARKYRGRLRGQAVRAVFRRGGPRSRRWCAWSSAPSFRRMCPTSSAGALGRTLGINDRESISPAGRSRRAIPGDRLEAAGHHPEFPP